jgi:hypothetical protein
MAIASQFVEVKAGTQWSGPELKSLNLTPLTGGRDLSQTTVQVAYQGVPWFRRAIDLRANAVASFPLELQNGAGDDVSEQPEYQNVMLMTRKMLRRVERNLCKYGAAYHLLESNRYGLNITPRFIPTRFVYPIIDYQIFGVTGFIISWVKTSGEYPLEKLVWLWEPNDESEIWPGPALGEAGLKAAGILYSIQEMLNRYMGSGGVPVTAVLVPPTVDKPEREKIENWLARFAGGFRNAFKFLAVDKSTEFMQIGSLLKDMESDKLTLQQQEEVAVAMEVPPSVINGKAANFATAESEMVGFYQNSIIPRMEWLEPELNTQFFQKRLGLTLKFQPGRLKIMQILQQKQAQGVMKLVGDKPIASVNEARGMVELDAITLDDGTPDPRYDEIQPTAPAAPSPFGQPASGGSVGQVAPAGSVAQASPGSGGKSWDDGVKYNENHDEQGRFSEGAGGGVGSGVSAPSIGKMSKEQKQIVKDMRPVPVDKFNSLGEQVPDLFHMRQNGVEGHYDKADSHGRVVSANHVGLVAKGENGKFYGYQGSNVFQAVNFIPGVANQSYASIDSSQMRALLATSLEQFKAGKSAAVGIWFDDKLSAASSGNMIRSIYEQHWPRPTAATNLYERAVMALETFNAIAAGSM